MLRAWVERRRAIRRRWKDDASLLIDLGDSVAYYAAQTQAARAKASGDQAGFWHWAKVAAEVARRSRKFEMDPAVVRQIYQDATALGEHTGRPGGR